MHLGSARPCRSAPADPAFQASAPPCDDHLDLRCDRRDRLKPLASELRASMVLPDRTRLVTGNCAALR
jgi:hypothetical protein